MRMTLRVMLLCCFIACIGGCAVYHKAQPGGVVTRSHPYGPDANWEIVKRLSNTQRLQKEQRLIKLISDLQITHSGSDELAGLKERYAQMKKRWLAALPKEFVGPNGISFVLVMPGEFLMGSNKFSYEKPVHTVRIARPFYMGKYEVTERQLGKSSFNRPANNVSWNQCRQFCHGLSAEFGGMFRLPTEAEWEYACRAGTRTNYNFGDNWSEQASRKPNPWGLYDMHGNLWEFCADWFNLNYYGSSPKEDPKGPVSGTCRVLRGGGWILGSDYCRSASRNGFVRGLMNNLVVGFRVVRGL